MALIERFDEPEQLTITVTRSDSPVVVTAIGELDMDTAPRLRAALEQLAAGRRRVVLDFSGLRFIDSSGIAAFAHMAVDDERWPGGRVVVRSPQRQVRRAIELVGLGNLIED